MGRDGETALRNEKLFREANEKIAERRGELDAIEGRTPFLCECEDETCTSIIPLSIEDYRSIRAAEHTFVVVPGHPTRGDETELHGEGWMCISKAALL